MKAESKFRQSQVWPFLKTLKNSFFTAIQQVSIRGTPDYIGCARGRFIGLELKTDEGTIDPLQQHTLDQIEKSGGVSIIARPSTWPTVKAKLRQLDEGVLDD